MTNRTYTIPTEGEGFAVVTESYRGARGWALSYIADDRESNYSVYDVAAGLRWPDGADPEEDGADVAEWDRATEPTDAVAEKLRESYSVAFYAPRRGSATLYGVRPGHDGLAILTRTLRQAAGVA